jgi:pimeloyl-ACP methyl ester carboxylesterase
MTLSWTTRGTGPVHVLAAHSWSASGTTFAPLYPYLDPDETTWVFPDFRGYGTSAELAGEFSIPEMAADLLGVADALGWDAFHLVGHSMGGQAAQLVTGLPGGRERVLTLSLVSSVPSGGFPLDDESQKFFGAAAEDSAVMAEVVTVLTGRRHGPGFGRHLERLMQSTTTTPTLRGYLRAWTQDDVSSQVGGFERPVLVLAGEHDPVLGPEVTAARITSRFRDARQVTVPAAGHFPTMETPARTAGLINAHISGRPGDVAAA